jgi:hypothetical protein
VCACSISRCGSGDSGNADCGQQRNNSDPLLPSATPAALRPPDNQSVYPLDERNSKPQNSTPAPESLRPPSNHGDDDAPVSEAADPRPTTTHIPFPVLAIVGLLALFWVWVIDGTMMLRPRLGYRSGRAAAREKGGCRCRVCTLRMQARGQPLHDVSENVA